MRYVKTCPRCGHKNDELSEACEKDGEFLGMVPAMPDEDSPVATEPAPHDSPELTPPLCEEAGSTSPYVATPVPTPAACAVTQRFDHPTQALYLDLPATGQCYDVRDGWVAGQAHPTSPAQIQLAGMPGVNFVHRNHCRFEFRDGRWHVTPIAQATFTNPTLLNQQRLSAGQAAALRNGDRLTLSSVALSVRIIEL